MAKKRVSRRNSECEKPKRETPTRSRANSDASEQNEIVEILLNKFNQDSKELLLGVFDYIN